MQIRKPYPGERQEICRLIYLSGPAVFDYFFASSEGDVRRILEMLYDKTDNAFSRDYMLAAVVADRPAGVILALPGSEKKLLEKNIGRYGGEILRLVGATKTLKMIFRGRLYRHLDVVGADEYYISNLAVDSEHRGRGIGPALLEAVAVLAWEKGYRKMSLLVEDENSHALHVYLKYGFVATAEVKLPEKYVRYGLKAFCKLEKFLA